MHMLNNNLHESEMFFEQQMEIIIENNYIKYTLLKINPL